MMINLIIEYNADNGAAVPDGQVQDHVNYVVNEVTIKYVAHPYFVEHPYYEKIGSVVLFDAFRVAVKEDRLDHERVTIRFNGKDYKLDKNGKMDYWPPELACIYDDILDELI